MYAKRVSLFCILVIISCQKSYGYQDDYNKELLDIFGLKDPDIPSLRLIHNGNKSYFVGDILTGNFLAVEQFCRYHGMNLVTIESEEENKFLQEKLVERGNSNQVFQTSATRIPSNRWVWLTNGKPVKYTRWSTGEPNNIEKEEQCIVVKVINKEMKWYDIQCWHANYFICEVTWTKNEHRLLEILKNKPLCDNSSQVIDLRADTPKLPKLH